MSVKIYGESGASFSSMGAYVSVEDYESLQAALREALNGWEAWLDEIYDDRGAKPHNRPHEMIPRLRKQFLDDKEPS